MLSIRTGTNIFSVYENFLQNSRSLLSPLQGVISEILKSWLLLWFRWVHFVCLCLAYAYHSYAYAKYALTIRMRYLAYAYEWYTYA